MDWLVYIVFYGHIMLCSVVVWRFGPVVQDSFSEYLFFILNNTFSKSEREIYTPIILQWVRNVRKLLNIT